MYVPDLGTGNDLDSAVPWFEKNKPITSIIIIIPSYPSEDFGKVEVQAKIMELSQLPSTSAAAGDYGNVRYLAQQLLDVVPQESFEERVRISGCLGRLAGV